MIEIAPLKERIRFKFFKEIGWPISIPSKEHDLQIAYAEQFVNKGQHINAYFHFFMLRHKYPGNSEIIRLQAYSFLSKKLYAKAAKLFLEAASLDTNKARNWIEAARCYHYLGDICSRDKFFSLVKSSKEEDFTTYDSYLIVIKECYPLRYAQELHDILSLLPFNAQFSTKWIKQLAKLDVLLAKDALSHFKEIEEAKEFYVLKQAEFELSERKFSKALSRLMAYKEQGALSESWLKAVRKSLNGLIQEGKLGENGEALDVLVKIIQEVSLDTIHNKPGLVVEIGKICGVLDPPELRPFSRTPLKETALDYFLYILEHVKDFEKIKMPLVRLLIRSRSYKRALNILESYLEKRNTEEYYLLKITLLLKIGDIKDARRLVREALLAYPDSIDLKVAKLQFLQFQGQTKEALALFEDLLSQGVRGSVLRDYFRLLYSSHNKHLLQQICNEHKISIDCDDLRNLMLVNNQHSKDSKERGKESSKTYVLRVNSLDSQISEQEVIGVKSDWFLVSTVDTLDETTLLPRENDSFITYRRLEKKGLKENKQLETTLAYAVRTEDIKHFIPNTALGVLKACERVMLERPVYSQIEIR